ncbi:tribbles homolog 3 [Osmerus eperlanus]|uniref:tribbles homolog 3 n=1 Tax=Osmerus eperlanus TaxID=29151 RepID=UPI002E105439
MSVNLTSTPATSAPLLCLKRAGLDDPEQEVQKHKRPRLAPPPCTGLAPYLRPRSHSPVPPCADSHCVSSIGPYILLEPCEGAETFRAIHRVTEQQYTCKVFPLRRYREVVTPYACLPPHDNISRISEVLVGHDRAYLFFQRTYGDMHSYVRTCKRLQEVEAVRLFGQMVAAVAHCHANGLVLRDLKLRKFVFADPQRTKLLLVNLEDSSLFHGDDDSLTDKHGCPAYVGPEILIGGLYSGRASDVWSLGVCVYTMVVGRYPFQDTKPAALFTKIQRGAFTLPDWLSAQARSLIGCMLRKSPSERLKASELLLHPWLTNTHTHHQTFTPLTAQTHLSLNTHSRSRSCADQVVPTYTPSP